MRTAGILNSLGCEEQALGSIVVEVAVQRLLCCRVWSVGRVFEEENDTVDGVEGGKRIRLKGQELFELYILDAEIIEQVGEDTLNYMSATL